jgi:cell division protein FtsL
MINLIPPSAKRSVIREYWKRVATVWLFLLSATAVILSVFLLPTYLVLTNEISSLKNTMSESQSKISNYDVSVKSLVSVSQHSARLIANKQDIQFSAVSQKLQSLANEGVVIDSFIFTVDSVLTTLQVSGTAEDRTSLVSFKDKIQNDNLFSKVSLPISNLIKDKNLPFSMEITLATTTKK